jgi:hypothetical protein
MGLRFWGGYTYTLNGLPDPTLDDDREDLADAIRDHPALEIMVFRGPSRATFLDVSYILKGAKNHPAFRSLLIPVVPPEDYTDERIRGSHYRMFTHLLYRSRSLTNVLITNGSLDPRDESSGYGQEVDSEATTRLQKSIKRILNAAQIRRNIEGRNRPDSRM